MIKRLLRRVASSPWIFDRIQYFHGLEKTFRRLEPYLTQTEGQIVLDVGAGTGNFVPLLPRQATYLWMDNDVKKLRGFKGKWPFHLALLGDATRIGLKDKSVDYAICIALSHHLPEPDLFILFSELARVVRKKLIFLDAVKDNGSKISHWLWKFDRGSYPRPSYILFSAIETWFKAEHIEHYLIQHEYVLYIGIPREK